MALTGVNQGSKPSAQLPPVANDGSANEVHALGPQRGADGTSIVHTPFVSPGSQNGYASARRLPDSSETSGTQDVASADVTDAAIFSGLGEELGALFGEVLKALRELQRESRDANRTIANGAFDQKIAKNLESAGKMREAAEKNKAAAKKTSKASFLGGFIKALTVVAAIAIAIALPGVGWAAAGGILMAGMALGSAAEAMINGKAQGQAADLNAQASEKEAERAEADVEATKKEKVYEQFQDLKKQAVEALQELLELLRQLGQTKQAVRQGWSR